MKDFLIPEGRLSPGKRLKHLRALLKLSRAYIHDKYGIPEVTMKSWENETVQITKIGAERCVQVYRSEGLITSVDWILHGIGLDPKKTIDLGRYFLTASNGDIPFEENDEVCMIRDANLFKETYSNAVVMLVSNDEMRPFFKPGDYVGGKMRYGSEIDTAVNKNCIIHLKDGEKFFRRLVKNLRGEYNLICLNPNEVTHEPVIFNVKIEGVAPIIWHRIRDD